MTLGDGNGMFLFYTFGGWVNEFAMN